MSTFHKAHAALFDELERQGIGNVDVGRLTRAVLSATNIVRLRKRSLPHSAAEPLRQWLLR